jgi:hypothetical protein
MSEPTNIEERIAAYCHRRQLERLGTLGSEMHGHVLRASSPGKVGEVALKVHLRARPFEIELETYLRLREANVTQIVGFNVLRAIDSAAGGSGTSAHSVFVLPLHGCGAWIWGKGRRSDQASACRMLG